MSRFVNDELINAVHEAYDWGGPALAVMELRRRFRDLNNEGAQDVLERILSWERRPVPSTAVCRERTGV